ncbi:AlpA family transcriptional regulator [Pseudonocardia sp. ICBG601]|uniref:helix-turn-helix transcriptional regulator n=1 Tax=Pseudonocardia sp. ICBG601 TaxID=2846759 RepID=UPI001CF6E13C|nr:helix-turn-helix domain-containing protein [Pseudonocardia sp. ICBG601]
MTGARAGLGSRAEVAEYLRVPVSTLDRWARLGTGPRYARVGRHARYRWSDVETWLLERTRRAGRET